MKFVLKKTSMAHERDVRFWFVLVAANGEIVMTSEMYTRKGSAIDTMASITLGFKEAPNGCPFTEDET